MYEFFLNLQIFFGCWKNGISRFKDLKIREYGA
jgi:hypothetical protein